MAQEQAKTSNPACASKIHIDDELKHKRFFQLEVAYPQALSELSNI